MYHYRDEVAFDFRQLMRIGRRHGHRCAVVRGRGLKEEVFAAGPRNQPRNLVRAQLRKARREIDYHRASAVGHTERVSSTDECLDILRGFALLGMFIVHFHISRPTRRVRRHGPHAHLATGRNEVHGTFACSSARDSPSSSDGPKRTAGRSPASISAGSPSSRSSASRRTPSSATTCFSATPSGQCRSGHPPVVDSCPAGNGGRLGRVRRAVLNDHYLVAVPLDPIVSRRRRRRDGPRRSLSMMRSRPRKSRPVTSSCWARASGIWPGFIHSRSS